jgi:type I restriction enzyme S subunit
MAGGYPLTLNGVLIPSSEALYQACRFPHHPNVQRLIISQASPMTAKMKGKPHRHLTREDWDAVRVKIMRWCLRVKLAEHWDRFRDLLLSTGARPIVEESYRDAFWGAKAIDRDTLRGCNVLGRLLMELRTVASEQNGPARVVPPALPDFLLYGERILSLEPPRSAQRLSAARAAQESFVWNPHRP